MHIMPYAPSVTNFMSTEIPGDNDELLDKVEQAEHEYKLDRKIERLIDFINQGIPVTGFEAQLGESLWLRELLKDLNAKPCHVCGIRVSAARSKAITLIGEWMGLIGSKAKKKSKRDVVFDDE